MIWIYLFLLLLLVLLIVRVVVKRPGHEIDIYEFEHWVHSFTKIKKEGGTMTFSHSKSPLFLRFRRGAGSENRCRLLVDVPRARWSEPKLGALHMRLEQKGIVGNAPADNPGVLLRIELKIPDVWDEASGATGARVAQDLFAALGLDEGARFNVSMKGENSLRTWGPTAQRWKQDENRILRRIGQKIEDGVKNDVEPERSESNVERVNENETPTSGIS